MVTRLRTKLTYPHIVSTLALFIALGGGAYAAGVLPRNSVGPAQLKSNSVNSAKVRDSSLTARDFAAAELAKLKGAKGDAGPTGAAGSAGPAGPLGPAGPQGTQGVEGIQGVQGIQGEPGSDAQFDGATAGGDLSGTYPDPQIGLHVVDASNIYDGQMWPGLGSDLTNTFQQPQIASEAVGSDEIANGSIQTIDLGPGAVSADILPAVPAAKARAANLSVANNSLTQVALTSTEEFDPASMHPANDPLIVAQRDGVYLVSAQVEWASNATGYRQLLTVCDCAVGTVMPQDVRPAANGFDTVQSVSGPVKLAQGNTVSMSVLQNSGGSLNALAATLALTWISP